MAMDDVKETLVLIKPNAVKRRLTGNIIRWFEQRGLCICAMKMLRIAPELAAKHYAEHIEKPFYGELVEYITSGPVVAMVVSGPEAVEVVRHIVGATNPLEAAPGSIRGKYATSICCNAVHASDSEASAKREIALFFEPDEIVNYGTELWEGE